MGVSVLAVLRRGAQLTAVHLLVVLAAGIAVVPAADAAPRDVYVLDIGRVLGDNATAAPGRIVQVNGVTGAELREIVPSGEGVEQLTNPVGITVDAEGHLIVADTDGYNATYRIPNDTGNYECVNGCGAVLRINPATGAAQVLSRGPYWANPSAVLLPPDGSVVDDGGGPEDEFFVTDTGEWAVWRVDPHAPPNENQTPLFIKWTAPGESSAERTDGLRLPWDIARDPDTNDLLITNGGVRGTAAESSRPLLGQPGCDDDPGPALAEYDGYIVRMSTAGEIREYICDSDFRRPRGIVAATRSRWFVSDPFAIGSSGSDYAGVFAVDNRDADLLILGRPLETPSGISFSYEGQGLLVADEAALPPASRDCGSNAGGCGAVFGLNPVSGDPTVFSPQGAPLFFRDPIDVAVDRAGAPAPLQGKPRRRHVRLFNVAVESEIHPDGIARLVLAGVGDGTKLRLTCLSADCSTTDEKRAKAVDDHASFGFGEAGKRAAPKLTGKFRVAVFTKRRNLRAQPKKARVFGRFRVFRFTAGPHPAIERVKQGCLEPGTPRVTPRTTVKCPRPNLR